MQTVGVICEYNPFHLGHARQLAAIRQQLGAGRGRRLPHERQLRPAGRARSL